MALTQSKKINPTTQLLIGCELISNHLLEQNKKTPSWTKVFLGLSSVEATESCPRKY